MHVIVWFVFVLFFVVCSWLIVLLIKNEIRKNKANLSLATRSGLQTGNVSYQTINYDSLGISQFMLPGGLLLLVGTFLAIASLLMFSIALSEEFKYEPMTSDWFMLGVIFPGVLLLISLWGIQKGWSQMKTDKVDGPSEQKYQKFITDNGFEHESLDAWSNESIPYDLSGIQSQYIPTFRRLTKRITRGTYQGKEFEFVGVRASRLWGKNRTHFFGLVRRECRGGSIEVIKKKIYELNTNQTIIDVELSANMVTLVMSPYPPIDKAGVMRLFQFMDAIDEAACATIAP